MAEIERVERRRQRQEPVVGNFNVGQLGVIKGSSSVATTFAFANGGSGCIGHSWMTGSSPHRDARLFHLLVYEMIASVRLAKLYRKIGRNS